MENWTIRPAQNDDAEALAACIDAAYAHYAGRINDLPAVSEDCAAQIAQFQVWVAENGSEIAAALILSPDSGVMTILNVAVHSEHKGKGLGQALMKHADTQALQQGCHEMHLATHVDIPENVRFYERLGWVEQRRSGNKVFMSKAV